VGALFVADTSLFPTPSGANPMITCQATAAMVARGLAERLLAGGAGGAAAASAKRAPVAVGYQEG
jgi:choline dehydrogenase-like flavoprotein